MNSEVKTASYYSSTQEKFPAIGMLTESVNSWFQSRIWTGSSDAALKRDFSLHCFAGGSLKNSPWDEYEPQRNVLYKMVDTNKLKGLIIAGSVGSFVPPGEFEEFYSRFKSIPMVCLGPEIQSVPTIVVDNSLGMRDLISHLLEYHGCRKIAFVRGPEGNIEAEQRFDIFMEVMRNHGIEPVSDLIISGDFSREAGEKAVEYLVDHGKILFDAIVGANDETALGALNAFHERHIKVPDEVLVAGFDDIDECSFSAPPLTTVRQPLYEMGSKAVEVLIDLIEGKPAPQNIIVPAKVSIRQSCGCYRPASSSKIEILTGTGNDSFDEQVLLLKKEVASVIEQSRMNSDRVIGSDLVEDFTNSFIDELTWKNHGQFVWLAGKVAWQLAISGGNTPGLIRAFTSMRQFARAYFGGFVPDNVEELFQSASLAIADTVVRSLAHRYHDSEKHNMLLRAAGQAIASAFDLEHLFDVIAEEISKIEIAGCWLSLYEDSKQPFSTSSIYLALNEGKRINIDMRDSEFFCSDLAPDTMLPSGRPSSLLVEPLFFRDEQIGFIVFDILKCKDGLTYEILRQHISSALKGALLMKKVQEQALALEIANKQLQKLRDAEHAYLEAIKHELEFGREIQSSFLPREIPKVPGWEICPAFQPAREVSGDFYDVFALPENQIALVISDVSGKDVGAALFMSVIRTLIRALAEKSLSGASRPIEAVHLTNRYLINHHYGNNGRYMYATLFMAILDTVKNTITYVNAGHNAPAIVLSDGQISRWIGTTGPAVGIIPDGQFGEEIIELAPGEMLFMYTDGVTEARNPEGSFFSKKKLTSILNEPFSQAEIVVQKVECAIKDHCAGKPPYDDITILALRRSR